MLNRLRLQDPNWFCLLIFIVVFLGAGAWVDAQQQDPVSRPESKVVTAVRVENGRIRVDGELDEPEWKRAPVVSDFVQVEPRVRQPATELTEVRLLYDDVNLYIGVYCFDSLGKEGIVVNSIAKDFPPFDSDHFVTVMDPFDDNRNGNFFNTNPGGAKRDEEISRDGADNNINWDGIWHVKTKVTESGWQTEQAIPFKTLRFRNQQEQVWGINFQRSIRRKNETVQWSLIPRPYRITHVSGAGSLLGISSVRPGLNLYVKPYVTAPIIRRRADDTDFLPDAGLDVKYSISSQLTLDVTANTDFSQVEADDQQINLTRFSLFFPEKREFFLENDTVFRLGPFAGMGAAAGRDLIPFFTRRIGISEGELVPILGGARLTGRVGDTRLGLLSIQVDETKTTRSTNFSTVRVRQNILRRSDIGGIFVNKDEQEGHFNRTFGADANFNFFNFLDISSFLLKTASPRLRNDDVAGHLAVGWVDPLLTLKAGYLSIGRNFRPEVGFVPRTAVRKSTADAALRLRPERRGVRQLEPSLNVEYLTDPRNVLETRSVESRFTTTFQNGAIIWVGHQSNFERLTEAFRIRPRHFIPPGDYRFDDYTVSLTSDRSRLLSGEFRVTQGDFYNGEKDSYRAGARLQVGPRVLADLTWSRDNVRLRSGDFQTRLLSWRLGYAFGPFMALNALIQYNSDLREISSNVRFNFTYKPLSDLYIVYNEKRAQGGPVTERAIIAKLTYVFAF